MNEMKDGMRRYFSILRGGLTCGVFRSADEALVWAQTTGKTHPLVQGFFEVVSYEAPEDSMNWTVQKV